MRGELDQLSCELKRCRYAMQKRDIEVSKRELGRYAPKIKNKKQDISRKCGRLGSSGHSDSSHRLRLPVTIHVQ